MRVLPKYRLLDHDAERPILLAGTPRRLSGRAHLHNDGDARAVVRAATLRGAPVAHLSGDRTKAAHEGHVSLVAILRPGQRVEAPHRAAIDPTTPPGTYEASLVLGEHAYPVVLEVMEEIGISASPTTILVDNEPGSRVRRRVAYRNTGNVPVTVGRVGALAMDEQLAVCRTIRGALAEDGDRAETADQWLTAFLRQGRKQLEKSGLLWVDAPGGAVTIAPGDSAIVELEIRVPDTIDRSSRYFAVGFVYDIDLQFVVVPTGAAEAPPQRQRRRT